MTVNKQHIIPAAILAAIAFNAVAVQWRVTALTPEYLLVQADITDDESAAFFANVRTAEALKISPDWKQRQALQAIHEDVQKNVREPFAAKMKEIPGFIAYWPEPNGVKRYWKPDGDHLNVKAADVVHNAFVKVAPMKKDDTIDLGQAGKFVYDPAKPTPVFKVNQVGYMPKARKYAYLGAWLAAAGPLPLKAFDGKPFEVVDEASGSVALSGTLKARREDPVFDDQKGLNVPFTGEEVLEIDLTQLVKPGRYFIRVAGIGRSRTFNVDDKAIAFAWGVHMQGLFNKRCGIEKKAPYTQWPAPACHLSVYRGVHPPDNYSCIMPEDGAPLFDAKGKKVEFTGFNIISANEAELKDKNRVEISGGYHDAADYDRRPMHLDIPRALALLYLLRPQNFTDSQLCIPESGNGIPDILDEAYWGVRHLLKAQQADGGVGTWIETVGHPGGDHDGPERDSRIHNYAISLPTHDSCYEFIGAAALVARAFKAAGDKKTSDELLASSLKAWAWCEKHGPVEKYMFAYAGKWKKGSEVEVVYHEPARYSRRKMLCAALNLAALTGDNKYFEPILKCVDDLRKTAGSQGGGWSPFTFLEFALKDQPLPTELEPFRDEWIQRRVKDGDILLKDIEDDFPYRTPWLPADDRWVTTMSWGHAQPLNRAQKLVVAHAFTGDDKYLEGALLANDFHNGANPRGESLTSGLGEVDPVKFLDLQSVSDDIAEYVAGITPYRWTFGIAWDAKQMVLGDPPPATWPIWRRYANVEPYTVATSEYTVWETIMPGAAVLGYLLPGPIKVPDEVYSRKPASDLRDLAGYWIVP